MSHVRGRFYFKLTDSGNLIGEYSHRDIDENRPESALRCSMGDKRAFTGQFISTWYEPDDHQPVAAELRIDPKTPSMDSFLLTWIELPVASPPRIIFEGEAMICDGFLVGDYQSV